MGSVRFREVGGLMDIILVGAMLLSFIGMMWCEMHDPLSRKFWNDIFQK